MMNGSFVVNITEEWRKGPKLTNFILIFSLSLRGFVFNFLQHKIFEIVAGSHTLRRSITLLVVSSDS